MRILDFILGQSLADSETENQRVGVFGGIPMLGLDALSSSAYGTEAALTILLPIGVLGLPYVVPITAIIIALLFIVYVSYRQTIQAYPNGGGSYTVAHENLGLLPGLLAAAALMLGVLALGIFKAVSSGGHPLAVEAMPHPGLVSVPVTTWLLLRAFASGCTAMTGVEAVSNGVSSFRQPVVKNAQRTLTTIILVLILMLAAIGYLAKAYGLAANRPSRTRI